MNKRKKVLIVTSEFPPRPGGIGNHAFNLASKLSAHKFDVSVVADQRLENFDAELSFDRDQVFSTTRIRLKRIRLFMYLKRIVEVFRGVSSNQIIIASGKFSLWSVALATTFYRRKYVAIIHGSEVNFSRKFLRKTIDISLQKFDKIIAVSAYTKSLVDYLGLTTIEVIHNGFSLPKEEIKIGNKLLGTPSLITVGSVTQRKGQKNVILAMPELIKVFPDIHYHIVGNPVEKEQFLQLAKDLHIENNITFHGIVSDQEKFQLLLGSSIFVMLSEQTTSGDVEGFGIALLEANYFEIPAIGAKNCGIEDAVHNHKSGILIDNKSPKEFVDAIETILNNYDRFKVESKEWSLQFTWEIIINKYIKALNS